MPCMTWKIKVNPQTPGLIVEITNTAKNLDEASAELPGGAYTTLRTFSRVKALHVDDHFTRLETSARLAGRKVTLQRESIRAGLRHSIDACAWAESRIRMTLDLEREPGAMYLSLEPLTPPSPEQYRLGVKVISARLQRENPEAKLTNFISVARAAHQNMPAGIYEVILVDAHGLCLEGASSNFYAVKNGEIWTAGQGVLSGITRGLVLEEAAGANIPVHMQGWPADQLILADEAFITSSSRAVLPVTAADGAPVGSGKVGPVSAHLLDLYQARIQREVEDL
jgi:branched-subunit amino acid aminotransferase/4-amino-4-deoxychorismate lyase